MKVQLEDNYKKTIKNNVLKAKMEHLTKVFARHDYENVLAVTFLNKDASQTPGQIVKSNKNAFDGKAGVGVQELTKMANGQRGEAASPDEGAEDQLGVT